MRRIKPDHGCDDGYWTVGERREPCGDCAALWEAEEACKRGLNNRLTVARDLLHDGRWDVAFTAAHGAVSYKADPVAISYCEDHFANHMDRLLVGPAEWWSGALFPPRDWQRSALPTISAAIKRRCWGIVRATMGAGKSILIAEVCASIRARPAERVIVTTSSVDLVEQLWGTIGQRCGLRNVGRYYGKRKELNRRVIVACDDSAPRLAASLRNKGLTVAVLIADEAHKTECVTYKYAVSMMRPLAAVGFTATPFRAVRSQRLTLWEREVVSYGFGDAIRDGVIVPPRIIPTTDEDIEEEELDGACINLALTASGPGVVSASDSMDADRFAQMLTEAGVPSASVHYRSGNKEEALAQLKAGELRCVVAVNMLTEGVDLPWLRWLILRRPMGSATALIQFAGRVLRVDRENPDKTEGVIYDPLGLFATFRFGIPAALGINAREAELTSVMEEESSGDEGESIPQQGELIERIRYTAPLTPDERYVYLLKIALSAEDLLPGEDVGGSSHAWRQRGCTPGQLKAIRRNGVRLRSMRDELPEAHLDRLRQVYGRAALLRRGSASDFVDVLFSLSEHGWTDGLDPFFEGREL